MNLPGLSFNPYTGLAKKRASALPSMYAPPVNGSGGFGLGGQLGDIITGTGATPTGLTGSGATPPPAAPFDFSSYIQNDPVYKQSLTDLGASDAANLASLGNGIRQLAIGYGQLPDQQALQQLGLPSDVFGYLNDEARGLAQKNTDAGLSTVARLNDANTMGNRQVRQQLAAHGALNSGEAGFQLGQLQKQFQQAQYDALQKLLGTIGGEYGQYNTQTQANVAAQRAAADEAANRANIAALLDALTRGSSSQNPSSTPPPAPPSPPYAPPNPNYSVNWAPTSSDIRWRISSPGGRGGV